jgi:hypothetical protein
MLVANAKERTYKNSFVKNIRLAKMPFKYDLILNVIISFKVSVYKLIIMNFRKYIRIKEILFLKYNLTKDLLEVVD